MPNDPGVTIPLPRTRANHREYLAPIPPPPQTNIKQNVKSGLETVIGYCNSMVVSTRRRVSPNTRQFWSKVKREATDVLKSRKMEKKEKDRGVEGLQIDLNFARARHEQLHGKDQLLQQLVNCSGTLMQYRLNQDYGDYLAKNLNALKQNPAGKERLRELLFGKSRIPWTEISDCLEAEEKETHRAVVNRLPLPDTPWTNDAHIAADTLGWTTADQIIWEVHRYAERNRACHNGLGAMLDNQQWYELGTTVLRDLKALNTTYPKNMPGERLYMKRAIETFRERYFEKCYYSKDGTPVVQVRMSEWPRLQQP